MLIAAIKPIQLIVGLGNPGPEYAATRHNAGAWFVEQLVADQQVSLKAHSKFFGLTARAGTIHLLIPTTFMNLSGQAVAAITRFYKIPPEAVLVAHDELDFPAGRVRLKFSGGHGGHNGLRDIQKALKTADFMRLRIGIGHPGHKNEVLDYVLHPPGKADRQLIDRALVDSEVILPALEMGDLEGAFRLLHNL